MSRASSRSLRASTSTRSASGPDTSASAPWVPARTVCGSRLSAGSAWPACPAEGRAASNRISTVVPLDGPASDGDQGPPRMFRLQFALFTPPGAEVPASEFREGYPARQHGPVADPPSGRGAHHDVLVDHTAD